ncbi:putative finger protein [Thermochaetoides thermophila DSM 1495]|uniref:Putative finger protein n=1 Tax=Chaetomium thermophilum (strain DSM 1495 / CBS 144.50 / IMI 039719) TaxID=759272 RepID=G0SFE1_CHATD|nr:putative finger protein [Thermochaetoides thermophila DSM 1495]EGS18157.1 putative finger protein [Thermochaetoides thermophila DSM 1495]
MTSSVFFKFKSQKEPTRVEFDGTGISVFELKREIILRSGLGDGTDFDLVICADENMKEVYDDDTTIIPRSTTVIARRMPPKVPGKGNAARYVSGKMPIHAKNSSRREQIVKPTVKTQSSTLAQLSSAMTEEEKMAAVFQAQTENFTAREEEMATQQYVAKGGPKKPANVPDHDPPQGYICYRCGEKGHWIQLCPTNDNPEYDNRPRVKRTTGIPRSFLKTVDKATALGHNADGDESKVPSGIMVNADGEFVIAEPDKASWEQFQAKAKAKSDAKAAASEGDKEIRERGLECPVDKKMFIEPMKTPCCEKTYCNDCITNALIESDFVCPACKTEGVLIDDLKPDEEAVEKIKAFLAEKDSNKKKEDGSKSPRGDEKPESTDDSKKTEKAESVKATSKSPSPTPSTAASVTTNGQTTQASTNQQNKSSTSTASATNGEQQAATSSSSTSKKRPADELLENPKIPKAPKAMQQKEAQHQQQDMMNMMPSMGPMGFNPMMGPMGPMMYPGMPPMMPNFPMGPNPMGMGFPPMMNPMMFPNGGPANGMNGWGPGPNGMMNGWGGPNGMMNSGMGMGGPGMGFSGGPNQHKTFTHQPPPSEEEEAYFRKPVNPHRHMNRQRRIRPSDYREL